MTAADWLGGVVAREELTLGGRQTPPVRVPKPVQVGRRARDPGGSGHRVTRTTSTSIDGSEERPNAERCQAGGCTADSKPQRDGDGDGGCLLRVSFGITLQISVDWGSAVGCKTCWLAGE
jgi:hypothetical protein